MLLFCTTHVELRDVSDDAVLDEDEDSVLVAIPPRLGEAIEVDEFDA